MMFDDVRDLYNATIIERGRRPQHMHRLESFDATAKGDNPMCGDRVQVWVKRDGCDTISAVGFEARGCEISKASADLMVEAVAGRTAEDTKRLFAAFRAMAQSGDCPDCAALDKLRPLASVHEYPSRIKCATLPWHALVAALDGQGQASSE
jgi:nitrogen fixation protein NifU and related proteins